ncbi:hypothetical protein AB0I84_04335 [Streptomyces spectabilis]|uniref:hypothetical protein n=1 Tax=Streptomyces spectabilis TaxID=68270 RepID=UPI0033F1DB63
MASTNEEPTPRAQRMIATCHTDPGACPVSGIPFTGTYYAAPEPPLFRGVCMGCEQPITDLVPVAS